jgi:hypothetical protein
MRLKEACNRQEKRHLSKYGDQLDMLPRKRFTLEIPDSRASVLMNSSNVKKSISYNN